MTEKVEILQKEVEILIQKNEILKDEILLLQQQCERFKKEIKKIKFDLKYYLDTNEENGVVFFPKHSLENLVKEMESESNV